MSLFCYDSLTLVAAHTHFTVTVTHAPISFIYSCPLNYVLLIAIFAVFPLFLRNVSLYYLFLSFFPLSSCVRDTIVVSRPTKFSLIVYLFPSTYIFLSNSNCLKLKDSYITTSYFIVIFLPTYSSSRFLINVYTLQQRFKHSLVSRFHSITSSSRFSTYFSNDLFFYQFCLLCHTVNSTPE